MARRTTKSARIRQLEAEVANIRGAWMGAMKRRDEAIALANQQCSCRCHTGTCGENDMVMAERAVRLVELIRPANASVEDLDYLVQRAGADFARQRLADRSADDEVPF